MILVKRALVCIRLQSNNRAAERENSGEDDPATIYVDGPGCFSDVGTSHLVHNKGESCHVDASSQL